jgi:phosphatidylserine decarboxylase
LYKAIPFSAMSSAAGWLGNLKIESTSFRKHLFGLYSSFYGCNLDEAELPLESYETFNEFFSRKLKSTSRRFSPINGLLNPCDGKLLHCGELSVDNFNNTVFPEQVKGSLYKLNELVGIDGAKKFSKKPDTSIFYCTIYLAPGDYHRFHSPSKIRINSVIPFSGEVLSVAPWIMKLVPKLLCMNERVAINGTWRYGAISYVPVGAANVGSIIIEPTIKPKSVINSGTEIGRFELGSTIAIVFEAPSGSKFAVNPGETVKLGQPLFKIKASWFSF